MTHETCPEGTLNGLSEAIRSLAPTAALIRILPDKGTVTHLYDDEFFQLLTGRETELEVTRLVRRHFADVADWRRSHDFHVPTGNLYRSPEAFQNGYVPEDDQSFGMTRQRFVASADGGDR
ncbi:hypothetical protein GCM10010524_66450 [Streptomyces mexicanus]|jgi:hypothetical protein